MSNRRTFLEATLALAASAVLYPLQAFAARPTDAFATESLDKVLSMFPSAPEASAQVKVKAPEIAENGAVVPISVQYDVPGAESVTIVVEKNPNPFVAKFALTPNSGGLVSTRIKMGETSAVHAFVTAGDKILKASTQVKVTIGGCGG